MSDLTATDSKVRKLLDLLDIVFCIVGWPNNTEPVGKEMDITTATTMPTGFSNFFKCSIPPPRGGRNAEDIPANS